jgi:hypothetical protein
MLGDMAAAGRHIVLYLPRDDWPYMGLSTSAAEKEPDAKVR